MSTITRAVGTFVSWGAVLGLAILIAWDLAGQPINLLGAIGSLLGAGVVGVIAAAVRGKLRGEPESTESPESSVPGWAYAAIFCAGMLPLALTGAVGPYGDHHLWPWGLALACQASVVAVLSALLRRRTAS